MEDGGREEVLPFYKIKNELFTIDQDSHTGSVSKIGTPY